MYHAIDLLMTGQQFKKLYDKMLNEVAVRYKMTRIEIDVLLFLFNNPSYDTAKDIVELRFFAKSYVSKAVDSLIKRKYLRGRVDETDRRIIHLEIQRDADEIATEAKKAQEEFFDLLCRGISTEKKEIVREVISKMRENVKEEL